MLEEDFIKVMQTSSVEDALKLLKFYKKRGNLLAVQLLNQKIEVWDQSVSDYSEV